jgi:hypothetical protein
VRVDRLSHGPACYPNRLLRHLFLFPALNVELDSVQGHNRVKTNIRKRNHKTKSHLQVAVNSNTTQSSAE